MSNNIHKINIKLPIVTLNFSPIKFLVPNFQQLSRVFPWAFTLNLFICVITDLYKHIGEEISW